MVDFMFRSLEDTDIALMVMAEKRVFYFEYFHSLPPLKFPRSLWAMVSGVHL
jgi:hypothetical protein